MWSKNAIYGYGLSLALVLSLISCQAKKEADTLVGELYDTWCIQDINIVKQPAGYLMYVVNLNNMFPFAPYINRELSFKSPTAIQIKQWAGGYSYELVDYTPSEDGTIDLYKIPISGGKIVCVKGIFWFDKNGTIDSTDLKALVEVRTDRLNNGNPVYIPYNWGYEPTRNENIYKHLKRAPWEPIETQNNRLLEELIKKLNLPTQ